MNDKNSADTKKNIIKKYYQLGDIHFNSEGHKVIAEDFLKKFKF
jgi:lysophospholipase L1-like esterase